MHRRKEGFTLIELLVALGIVVAISATAFFVLNPTELLRRTRDAARLSDIQTIDKALKIFSADVVGGTFGSSSVLYVSLPDSSPTCSNYFLPPIGGGWSYACAPTSTYRLANGTGWIPVNFDQISFGTPFSALPIDPINNSVNGLYYTYAVGSWEMTAKMESAAYRAGGEKDVVTKDGGDTTLRFEVGTDLLLTPNIGDGSGGGGGGGNPAPTVTSVNPATGTTAGGTSVTISGTGFVATPSVTVGGTSASGITFLSSSSLSATTPAHGAGAVNVVVTNPDVQSGTCVSCFTYTATLATTTLANGTNPTSTSLAPGGAATMTDAFTFQTTSGSDTITAVTVSIAANTQNGLSLVEVTSDSGLIVYGSASNPSTSTLSITLSSSITANTTPVQFKIRITPKSHAAMPAPPGASYAVTVVITDWTGSNGHAGSDGSSATITIDNLSSGNATGAGGTPGNGQVVLSWTNPGDGDFSNLVVLRATSSITDVPAEGSAPNVNDAIGATIVRYTGSSSGFTDTGLINGTAYYYKIFAKDTNGNYATGAATGPHTPAGTVTVTSIAPTSSTNVGTSSISTISGSGFLASPTVKLIKTGQSDITGVGFSMANSSTINGGYFDLTGVATGTWNVHVINTDNSSGTLSNGFTVTSAPTQQNTGYLLPSATSTTGTWTGNTQPPPPPNPWVSDQNPPTAGGEVARADISSALSPTATYFGFNFGIPGSSSIDKICVIVDNINVNTSTAGFQKWHVDLTWDGGTSFTAKNTLMPDISFVGLPGIDYYFKDTSSVPEGTDPGTTCTTWGRTWMVSEMSAANFGVRVTGSSNSAALTNLRLDVPRANIYYTPP